IPYETKRILKYLALALVFVLVAMFMPLKDVLLRIVAGNTLLIIFSWLLLKDVGILAILKTRFTGQK
ncbi:MAG TPA: hypothetical protein VHO90_21090, partial [Bacteroidales bacterium]|nr:hypothetical protein [Bacteroidales bacterium]